MPNAAERKALHQFALTRSCNAAIAANENSRLMAQASLLINGAAATAVIAFLTKDKVEPIIFAAIPWTLTFYAIGVACGALAMFFMTEDLDFWNGYWEKIARREAQAEIDKQEAVAQRWWWYVQICFFLSTVAFLAGSASLACAIWRLPLPAAAAPGLG